ncbi:hypothetical protein BAUCODRAFT_471869 [Baudoinia panamericana UAMH 10762]|uniref:BTB domain-containing protein n=1 Tax=Baudoinia panamericana (strain UAMH 10762) TaxID=717646 RepID=M2MXP6_BAUPA|nr:uncharacterized protein BAUCODRAFT_471869 [Baudoinia panamericana UAMH 10762]EMC96343.1 hypothetical protein BAUCODRAFT_471869 [Baudoinia panamericana UAMH 10762]
MAPHASFGQPSQLGHSQSLQRTSSTGSVAPTGRLDEAKLFNQEAFADVVVKYGLREKKCHKLILCSKSAYFNDLFGPGKNFAEANTGVIELHDDDEEAVEAMLRWLYTFDYEDRTSFAEVEGNATPDFHLAVCLVADKYLLTPLCDEALSQLCKVLEGLHHGQLVKVIEKVYYSETAYPVSVTACVDEVRNAFMYPLLQMEDFRGLLQTDGTTCLSVIDKLLADAAKAATRNNAAILRWHAQLAAANSKAAADVKAKSDEIENLKKGLNTVATTNHVLQGQLNEAKAKQQLSRKTFTICKGCRRRQLWPENACGRKCDNCKNIFGVSECTEIWSKG